MCDPRLAPYSSQPKRNDLSITALTPPQSGPLITTIYLHDMQHETTTQCTPHIYPIKPFKEQKKSPMLLTDERYPVLPFSSAVFLDKSFSPPILPGHLAKQNQGGIEQASELRLFSVEARVFLVLILQNRVFGGWGRA